MNLKLVLRALLTGGILGALLGISWSWGIVTALGFTGFAAFLFTGLAFVLGLGELGIGLGANLAILAVVAYALLLKKTDLRELRKLFMEELPQALNDVFKSGLKNGFNNRRSDRIGR